MKERLRQLEVSLAIGSIAFCGAMWLVSMAHDNYLAWHCAAWFAGIFFSAVYTICRMH